MDDWYNRERLRASGWYDNSDPYEEKRRRVAVDFILEKTLAKDKEMSDKEDTNKEEDNGKE